MKAEILSVGMAPPAGRAAGIDEQALIRKLGEWGVSIIREAVADDGPERLGQAVGEGLRRCDIVVATGGPEAFGKTETVEGALVKRLKARGETVSFAESLTGGMVCARLVGVPGASNVLNEAHVTYADQAKHRVLGVSQETLDCFTAVSAACAREMAEGVRHISGADWGVATTGYAGPDGGSDGTPVGTVYIAVAGRSGTRVEECHFNGSRADVRALTASRALNALEEALGD